jgi:hypothetical protein
VEGGDEALDRGVRVHLAPIDRLDCLIDELA